MEKNYHIKYSPFSNMMNNYPIVLIAAIIFNFILTREYLSFLKTFCFIPVAKFAFLKENQRLSKKVEINARYH